MRALPIAAAVVCLLLCPEPAAAAEEPPVVEVVQEPVVDEYEQFLADMWIKGYGDQPLEKRLIRSIFRSRVPKGGKEPRWEQCGEVVPEEAFVETARTWVRVFLEDVRQAEERYGVKLPVWGVWATIANESSFNECSIDYYTRLWASQTTEKFLITETWRGKTVRRKVEQKVAEHFRLTYSRDDVWRIIKSEGFKEATVVAKDPKNPGELKLVKIMGKFDGGPMQMRTSSKDIPTRGHLDRFLSLSSGLREGIAEMARRALWWQERFREKTPHPRPWKLWPGGNGLSPRNTAYDSKIISVARWLGAKREEMDPRFMPPVY
jgi:hypothetical protein